MDPFLGEIQFFPYGFVPYGWALCDGRLLPIQSNSSLFALIGTYYGGNGTTNFALPNLVGRVAIGQGQGPGLPNYVIGEPIGVANVSVSTDEMPAHTHGMQLGAATSPNATAGPTDKSNVAIDPGFNGFVPAPGNTSFAPTAIVQNCNSLPHANTQPTLAMVHCIATIGTFPQFN